MGFVNAAGLVRHARENGYAVAAFNTNGGSCDLARAALEACEETGSPLILQSDEQSLAYRGIEHFVTVSGHLCGEEKRS